MDSTSPEMLDIVDDAEALSRAAADVIVALATRTLRRKDYFTIALSGGSTPKPLYARLANDPSYRSNLDWAQIHIFWGDERQVPPDHPESNYRMAYAALLSKVDVPAANIHRVRAEDIDASEAAQDYERELLKFFHLNTGELPRFDCILLGMGTDGHTASLFPGTTAVHEKERLVVANWVDKLQSHRITMTAPVFNNADQVIFLVSGEEKAETLQEVLRGKWEPDRFPSQLIKPTQGQLLWLVDRPAARLLA